MCVSVNNDEQKKTDIWTPIFFKLLRYNFVFNNKQKIVTICQEDTTILFPKFSFFYFVCLNMNKICKKKFFSFDDRHKNYICLSCFVYGQSSIVCRVYLLNKIEGIL